MGREVDARPLALVRILVPLVLLLDLLRMAQLGLVSDLFVPFSAGGLNAADNPHAWVRDLSPEWGGPITFGVALAALAAASAGLGGRWSMLVALVAYAQLGHICGPSDRGIDRILRTVMLILVFSDAHRVLAIGRPRAGQVKAWARGLITFLMVVVYLNSGVAKILGNPWGWLGWEGWPAVYLIVSNPVAGHVDPVAASGWLWLFRIGGWGTILLELSAPLLLTRFAPYWALPAAAMHLGIAATMELGMFSWGVLALYPLFFAAWIPRDQPTRT